MLENKHDIRCDIIANRLVIDNVRRSDADFEARFQAAWNTLYPSVPAPTGAQGLEGMWVSSRVMLEVADISLAGQGRLAAFVRERVLHYHMLRLKPKVFIEDVRSAAYADLTRMRLVNNIPDRFLEGALRSYALRSDSKMVDPARIDFNPRECMLITECYRFLIHRLTVSNAAKPEIKSAPIVKTESKPELNPVPVAKVEPTAEAAPAVNPEVKTEAATEDAAPSRRNSRRGKSHLSAEDLEKRTIKRLRGQFAIDCLMATRIEPEENEPLDDGDDDSELDQFIEACSESTTYKNYTVEQCTELWNSVMNEDRILFARGSLTALVDLRFTIIATRCLMMALLDTPENDRNPMRGIIERATEFCDDFRLDYKPEVISERLKRLCRNLYLINGRLTPSIFELLRKHKQDIIDAYNLYLEQSDAEIQRQEQEIARKVEDIRRRDALQRRNEQHAETIRLIRDFGSAEMGRLCMAVHGLPCSKEHLIYQLDGVLQKLETLGIEPIASSLVEAPFDGGIAAAKDVIDLSGHPLERGVTYRLIQPGWKYQGEIVVWPKADRVNP